MFSKRFLALYGAAISLVFFAGCSGGGTTNPLPTQPGETISAPMQAGSDTTTQSTTTQSTYTVKGYIDDVRSNGFHIEAGPGVGYIWVYTNSSTKESYNGLTPKVGLYAVATGTGSLSTYLTATYAALYTSASAATSTTTSSTTTTSGQTIYTVKGYIDDTRSNGFHINGGSGVGYIWVYTNSSTKLAYNGLTPKVGLYAVASGTGSLSTYITATCAALYTSSSSASSTCSSTSTSSTTTTTTSTPAPTSTSVPKHVLTAEYLQGLYGTTAITPTQAAPYLSWAQTTTNDTIGIHNAGIKTQVYVDPNWLATTDPLYPGTVESDFSHNCSGSRVTVSFGSASVRYDTNPNSSTNQQHFAGWVASQKSAGHVDMIFEDNPGPLSPYASYPNGMPCGYTSSAWVNGAIAMNNAVSVPVMVNGLNAFTTTTAPNLSVVLNGSNTAGGDLEGCYNDLNKPIETGSSWNIMEDTEIDVVRAGKLFECMGRDQGAASSNYAGRIFTLASFLMTYDPNHAVLAEEWATPDKFRVMPESGLVALNPLVAEPSGISGLKTAAGPYGREYSHCYYRGTYVGACAVAVNHDYGAIEKFPFSGYTHTLTLSGNGVLDGGTASVSGPAPPSTMSPYTAVIAFK